MFCEDTSVVDIPRTVARHQRLPAARGWHSDARSRRSPASFRPIASPCWPRGGRAGRRSTRVRPIAWCASRPRSPGRRRPSPSACDRAIEDSGAEVVLFGDAMPLAAIGPRLAARGTPYVVLGHGFDYWLSLMPGAHAAMRAATSRASSVLACSRFIARVVRTAVRPAVPVAALTPGADPDRFRPDLPSDDIRVSFGIGERPLVVCVSRLVARKGQDVLIRAMPAIRRRVPDAALLIVGAGPYEARLRRLAAAAPAGRRVVRRGGDATRTCPGTTRSATSSRCRAGTGSGASRWRGGATCSSRRRRRGGPSSPGTPAARGRRWCPARPGSWSTAGASTWSPRRSPICWPTGSCAILMGKLGRDRVEREHTWAQVAGRLAGWLRKAARGSAT